jgi:signal transduction histidine kinase
MPIQRSAWRGERIDNMEIDIQWEDGTKKTALFSSLPIYSEEGQIIGVVLTSKEITEMKRREQVLEEIVRKKTELALKLEKEVARIERLKLVGELSASLSHEIRNPMSSVSGLLQVLKNKDDLKNYKPTFDLMIDEINRANKILTESLSFAKSPQDEFSYCNLNDILKVLFPLLEANAILENIAVQLNLNPLPHLAIKETDMRQLIMNLYRNAIDAMDGKGVIIISTYVEGDNAILSIKDQGVGIHPENFDKIGSPFFTTKDSGTGLGLAVCYSIARQHQAEISYFSDASGTTFYVKFNIT